MFQITDYRTVKIDVAQLKAQLRDKTLRAKLRFRKLWNDPHEALLFRSMMSMLVVSSVCVLVIIGDIANVYLTRKAAQEAAERGIAAVAIEQIENKVSADPSVPGSLNPIPDAILDAQDGVEEEGKDLVESDLDRGGSAQISADGAIEVAPYNPFVVVKSVMGSTAENSKRVGRVALDVAFEVTSSRVKKELLAREKEIASLISGLIAEQEFETVNSEDGRLLLKKRIYDEVNFKLKSGRIVDVLYSSFVLR